MKSYSEDKWKSLWLRQATDGDVECIPGLVSEDIQARLHGTTGVAAMQGALRFRSFIKSQIEEYSDFSNFLDFGCGWGRHIRVFLKDFDATSIYGVDIDPSNISLLNEHIPDVNSILCYEGKNLELEDNSMDLIISFSVFSHINEKSAEFWLTELKRLLKPGGFLVITTWGKALFEVFDRMQSNGGKTEFAWEKNIDKAFDDKDKVRERYLAGDFVFGKHGQPGAALDKDVFGISLIPKKWFDDRNDFKVIKWFDDTKIVPQTTFFLQKNS